MQSSFKVVAVIILLGGCVSNTPNLTNGEFLDLTPRQTQGQNLEGKRVRWGGEITSIAPGKDKTCFEVNSQALDETGRPVRDHRDTQGIFIACKSGYHDSSVYPKGRSLTVTGALSASTTDNVGATQSRYPLVTAEQLYLWPKRRGEGGYGHGH